MSLPATERLYYRDAQCTEFEAHVLETDASRTRVVLDRTAFYPTSGGQPFDTGSLSGIAVVDVTEDGATIVHHLASALPADVVGLTGRVDWARRFDHMQQHSGQHVLSAVLEDQFGWPTVSVHFGSESCTLDVTTDAVTAQALRDAEQRANAIVTDNRPIAVSFEESASATGLRKPSDRDGVLRVITIEGIDRNACGGTHVAHTGAIGPILLRRSERLRGGTRIEFRCGARAVARARADYEVTQQLAARFSSAIDDLPALVTALHTDAQATEKQVLRLVESLAAHEAHTLYNKAAPDGQGRRLHQETVEHAPVKSRQQLAQQFTQFPNALFIAASHTPPAVMFAASADTGLDCGRLLKDALQAVGGRGGGTPVLAQGSVPSVEAAHDACARLAAAVTITQF